MEKNKIVIVGAGQIGVHCMENIITTRAIGPAEVYLISPHNHSRVEGAYQDILDAQALAGKAVSSWKFYATDDMQALMNAEIVVFCAGKFPKPEEYAKAAEQGIDDRLLQAVQNIDLLDTFCDHVNNLCPDAKVFILTNPVDMMTEIAREKLINFEVYGLGCYLDSARFKREFAELANHRGRKCYIPSIRAWILGHHSGTMFLHRSSFKVVSSPELSNNQELIAKALENTRKRGLTITKLNEGGATPKLNNGAYFAPAVMVAEVLKALVSGDMLSLPLNRRINEDDGVGLEGIAAQMPCIIEKGNIKPLYLKYDEDDINDLKHSVEEYEKSKKAFAKYIG